jgi:short-subunit dehydrogenase
MKDLAGRTAIVTGASRGIGEHVARTLAAEGVRVVLAARTASDLDAVAATIQARGGQALAVPTDVRETASLENLLAETERAFGPPDVLVNNAGVEGVCTYHKQALSDIEEVVDVNLLGTMRLTRLVLPGMVERGAGHVVNMSSLAGKYGPAYAESYAATKAALIAFTQSLRASYYSTGVRASVICPGFVDVGMYARSAAETGLKPPRSLGVIKVEEVSKGVVRAIVQDIPEVIVNARPIKYLLPLPHLAPGLAEKLARRMAANHLFREAVERREQQESAETR